MYLRANQGMGGFLQMGPHHYPPRPKGVQIIQRGPHGMRIAADPVVTREGRPRGSGFRFWHEELGVKADEKWNPENMVVGVMGMGELPSDWSCPLRTREQVVFALTELENRVRSGVLKTRGDWEQVRAETEGLRECHMQLGGPAGVLDRLNKVHAISMLKRGVVSPKLVDPTGAIRPITSAEYCRKNPQADGCRPLGTPRPGGGCASWDTYCRAKQYVSEDWWKIALGVGGFLLIYGVATSFGSGLGRGLAGK
jgi:hypothetical protein